MTPRDGIGPWRKSSYSAGNGNCVEVARYADAARAVRDSKNASGPTVAFTHTEWSAFIEWTKTESTA
ncbi:DUF397 domain-containing protein [Streptomyces sp. MS19]|uniref:DUF397 domain-containing protein n=1 Tax=Streptomyces sp. MS19 TaxID=3385972 RepID=UPI0039A3511E